MLAAVETAGDCSDAISVLAEFQKLGAVENADARLCRRMIESGVPDCESVLWFGISAPAGTPQPIIDKLSRAANEALKSDEVTKALQAQTVAAMGGTPEQFRKHMSSAAPGYGRQNNRNSPNQWRSMSSCA